MFLPRAKETEFVDACKRLIAKRYPDINGPDFTSIIDQRAYDRLTAALEDARAKGATLVNLAEGQTPDASKRKFPPHIVLHPTPDMEVMQREIFGPILPIRVYDQPQEVADAINAGDRPLALYPFTHDRATRDFYISRVLSGGVSVNDAILHVGQHDLPFGGVGRQRHGALPRPRGLRDLFEDEARVPAGTRVVRPDDDAAALLGTGETDGRLHDPDAKLGATRRRSRRGRISPRRRPPTGRPNRPTSAGASRS